MSPFLFSKYEGKRQRANRLIIPMDRPKDHTPLLAAIVISLVSASLLAIMKYDDRTKIASLRGACGIHCHVQEVPICKTLGEYLRGMKRQREAVASH